MCVLRAAGADFEVDAFLATSSLKAIGVRRKGELRLATKPTVAGTSVLVSLRMSL